MPEETIGQWSVQQLVRFLQEQINTNPPSRFTGITCDTVDVAVKLNLYDQIQLNQVQTTVGTAGSASALPANPTGYFKILDYTGQVKLVPYYNA